MSNEIIRTPSKVEGGITPAEKTALAAHTAKWIANAMSTEPVAPQRLTSAIQSLYAAAGLKEPRVVIVSSPLAMAMAGGFAAAIWWCRKNKAKALDKGLLRAHATARQATYEATYDATDDATREATDEDTRQATRDATYDATYEATDDATIKAMDEATDAVTYEATDAVTYEATSKAMDEATDEDAREAMDEDAREATSKAINDATYEATDEATYDATSKTINEATREATREATSKATYDATYEATSKATSKTINEATDEAMDEDAREAMDARLASFADELGMQFGIDPGFMVRCARNWFRMYQGGNMWGYYDCYITAFRDVLGLTLPEYEQYRAWEACAIEGGFRIMHEEFCIVCDRPEVLRVDNENRPHGENGPSHRWRDGWSLYHWHGVRIPGQWVSGNPPTAQQALTWPNIEQRRAAVEIVGWANILAQLDVRVIDEDAAEIGTLLEAKIPDSGAERFLKVLCGTGRTFCLPVPPDTPTALAANMWTYGLDANTRFIPEVRT